MRNIITVMVMLMFLAPVAADAAASNEERMVQFFFAGATGMEAEGEITGITLELDKEYTGSWVWPMYSTYDQGWRGNYSSMNGALGEDWTLTPECWPACDLEILEYAGSADSIRPVVDLSGKKLGTLISTIFLKFPTDNAIRFWHGWSVSVEGYDAEVTLWPWYWGNWYGYETWWVQLARVGSWVPWCDRPVNAINPECGGGGTDPETCNGVDDDLDGLTDEGFGVSTCGAGSCERMITNCLDGKNQVCTPGVPVAELCNNLDDDCDGLTDEDFGPITCGTGECQVTVDSCTDGILQACTPEAPGTEVCGDDIDQDCDGSDLVCKKKSDGGGGGGCFISSVIH